MSNNVLNLNKQMQNYYSVPQTTAESSLLTNDSYYNDSYYVAPYIPYVPYNQNVQYYFTTTTSYPAEPSYVIKVEKAENGFIVHKNGQKFIVSKPEDIAKYLKDGNGK